MSPDRPEKKDKNSLGVRKTLSPSILRGSRIAMLIPIQILVPILIPRPITKTKTDTDHSFYSPEGPCPHTVYTLALK